MEALGFALLLGLSLSAVRGECIRNDVRCPEYSVLKTNEEYEERVYPDMVWVSASAEAKQKMDISRYLIKQLYMYLAGDNSKGSVMRMMVPVRTAKVVKGETNLYTISILLLPELREDPPMPTNANITIDREPSTIYVVRSFGGYARPDNIWDHQADLLRRAVEGDKSVDTSFYYMNVYDSPWKKTDRLNEVWMRKV